MHLTVSLQQIINFILATSGVIAAVAVIYKAISPTLKLGSRVTKLEHKQEEVSTELKEMREESKTADRLLVRAMVEIVDNRITGNNAEGLKTTKKDLMAFLQDN